MSRPLAAPPDAERLAIDYLKAALADRGEDVTCGTTVPSSWVAGTKPHIQVALDGTPFVSPPAYRATVRVTAWSSSATTAKRLAALCEAVLLAHEGDPAAGWSGCRPGTSVLPGKDPATRAALASITVLAKLRALPL